LPSGTVTFLFTDIEGSTRLARTLKERWQEVLEQHHAILRRAIREHGGVDVGTEGDAFFAVFTSAVDAVVATAAAQDTLAEHPWPANAEVRVRMGVHTGEGRLGGDEYVGLDVHLAARVAAAGHGGQVLLSETTKSLATGALPPGLTLRNLGEHRLKDFDEPVQLFQLGDRIFPPLKTISNTNLPRPASAFVGRRREMAEIRALVGNGARFITLTGPGGSGKTRLAIEVASELVPAFQAGVFWVALAPVRDPALVPQAIGQTLGAAHDLAGHIGPRDMLLLLDNFEHVVEAAPELSRLVEACPNLALLVSSRELLRVSAEIEFAVPALAHQEAVDLFLLRARLPEPTDDVAELCARLDNLPLAVELAAARTKVLSPAQILKRLSNRLDLLKGGRDADPRQATLRATIDWSYHLLSPAEQRLFARLGIFAGGWTLEAAEAVCDADIDTLQSLVEKSLVRRSEERFSMLETIREFAVERLGASGEADELRRRHFGHYLTLAESANVTADAEGPMRHDLVIPEQANLRAAIGWADERGDLEGALRLAVSLENFWITTNPFEGVRLLAPLIERADGVSDKLRGRALRSLGSSRLTSGDIPGARTAFEWSLEVFRAIRDQDGVAVLLHRLGYQALLEGDLDRARRLLNQSREMSSRFGGTRLAPSVLRALGDLEYAEGNREGGIEMLQESVELADRIGFVWWQAGGLLDLAEMGLEAGRADRAEGWAGEALVLALRMNDRRTAVFALARLAWAAAEHGDGHRAGWLWGVIEAEEAAGGPVGGWESERDRFEARALLETDPSYEQGRQEGRLVSWRDAADQHPHDS
jgi:predicted ATPase/class 3 adenylate cyclase